MVTQHIISNAILGKWYNMAITMETHERSIEMERDEKIYEKVMELVNDFGYIRERLEEGRELFKEYGERMRILEQNQKLLTGKMTIIIMGIGAGILGCVHVLIWLIDKVMAK